MAEGILFNVAESILTKLGSLALQEIGLLWGLPDELNRLQGTVATIKAVLLDAEKQYRTRDEVRVWLDALKDAAYDADDLLDDIATETSRQQLKSGNVAMKEVHVFFSCSNGIAYGLKMAHKIKDIRARLDGIENDRKFLLNQNLVEPVIMDHDRDTHSSAPNVVIGREDDKKEIMSLLLADHEEDVVVIPIVGLGGLGKTTLAQMIYNDERVQSQFDLKAWVCVSDVFDIKSIVEKMIECIDGNKPMGNPELEILKNQLIQKIKGRKYLFVLDDIWNEDRERWAQLNNLVISGARGSRIIVTTRSMIVAEITGSLQPYEMKCLSEMESWDLFQKVAFKKGQAPNEEFERLGKEIAIKLCGLPLAIRTIGSLLYTKMKESEWQDFMDLEFLKLDPKINIIDTLKLSYNYLPSNLKYCFAYCSLFPKDYKFGVSILINYWKAQGYIDTKMGEGEGFNCYKHLLQRSFFQEEEENLYDGEVTLTCKMHDFMHDLAMLVAGEEIKLVGGNSHETNVTGKTRHVSLPKMYSRVEWKHLAPLFQQKKARTLIFNSRNLANKELHTIVDKLGCLRVLNLSDCDIKKLPSSIGRLKHLRELDLSDNLDMRTLPDSVTRLHNLQVLILDRCFKLQRLPNDMRKLVNMIHLGLWGCIKLEEMPQGIGQLTSLEVLPRFILPSMRRRSLLFKPAGGLDELHRLNKLRGGLEICNLQGLKKGALECEAANLKGKPRLLSLLLDWGEDNQAEDVSREEESLEALQPHINLLYLNLKNYGGARFPRWVSYLENLVSIEIWNCSNCKSLRSLDGLPSLRDLQVLFMKELEYMIDEDIQGGTSKRSCNFFPRLNKIKLFQCRKLKGWWRITPTTEDYQLPSLSELSIDDCFNLKGRMPQLPSLDNLELSCVSAGLLEETLKQAKTLKSLVIRGIEDLGSINEEALPNIASLKSMYIGSGIDSRALSPWLQHLTSLERLTISCVEEMSLFEEEENNAAELIKCLCNLRRLDIAYCDKMKHLPEGFRHLTSLETLVIVGCYELETLPAWIRSLTSLCRLDINACNRLTESERCGSNQGADWPLISHIPNIQVDHEIIQSNGSYQL